MLPTIWGATAQCRAAPHSLEATMTRRSLALALVTIATSALAACAEPSTAPQRAQLIPAGASSHDLIDPALCKGTWSSSEGRCI